MQQVFVVEWIFNGVKEIFIEKNNCMEIFLPPDRNMAGFAQAETELQQKSVDR